MRVVQRERGHGDTRLPLEKEQNELESSLIVHINKHETQMERIEGTTNVGPLVWIAGTCDLN